MAAYFPRLRMQLPMWPLIPCREVDSQGIGRVVAFLCLLQRKDLRKDLTAYVIIVTGC